MALEIKEYVGHQPKEVTETKPGKKDKKKGGANKGGNKK